MARINLPMSFSYGGLTLPPIHEPAATQMFSPQAELERLVSCALLGEKTFYVDGKDIESRIVELAGTVNASRVATLAMETREHLGLRHTPLLLMIALASRQDGREFVREVGRTVLRTPRDAMDLLALYWARNTPPAGKKRAPIAGCLKATIRDGFDRWSAYQVQKYGTLKDNVGVRLRDLLFLTHPDPAETSDEAILAMDDATQQAVLAGRLALWKSLADDTIRAPDTWEALLSVPGADKAAVWTKLLEEGKLGALALVRNLRNMEQVGVNPALVVSALEKAKAKDVWPWQALAAAREAPAYAHALDALTLRSAGTLPVIPGRTVVLLDVSGSMDYVMSDKGMMKRMDAGAGLAVVLREKCESSLMATFSGGLVLVQGPLPRGAVLANTLVGSQPHGGTNLGGAVAALMDVLAGEAMPDRLVIITDEQSQTHIQWPNIPVFCINVAPTQRGVNFQGPVTRINGWSGGVVRFLAQQVTGSVGAADEAEED